MSGVFGGGYIGCTSPSLSFFDMMITASALPARTFGEGFDVHSLPALIFLFFLRGDQLAHTSFSEGASLKSLNHFAVTEESCSLLQNAI